MADIGSSVIGATNGDAGLTATTTHTDHDDRILHQQPQSTNGTPAPAPPPPFNHRSRQSTVEKYGFDMHTSGTATPMTGGKRSLHHGLEFDEYFVGPRDIERHSKLPYFLRLQGSVLPRMILPLVMTGCWATFITCISKFVHPLIVSNVLLTVLGFVVGLALSFRSSTAYERYSDGRKCWATLSVQCRILARLFWVHLDEREGDLGKDDLLAKLTAMNLLLAFAVSLKHKLRFEPYAHYPDIFSLVAHLDTFAKDAEPTIPKPKHSHWYKRMGTYLGVPFVASNPRREIKHAQKPLGDLPLEILTYLSMYVEDVLANGTLKAPIVLGQMLAALASLTDTQASAERVLNTPLPAGYNILISQIVLLYVYLLPFQLFGLLGWITIPGTIAAAYIIIGLAIIGDELENPFGDDVNDLPLDIYCEELRRELDIMTSRPVVKFGDLARGVACCGGEGGSGVEEVVKGRNKVLWPLSSGGHADWRERSMSDIRSALKSKVLIGKGTEGRGSGSSSSNIEGRATWKVEP